MKYIRTYETEEKFLADKDSTSRGFRLKPTLYKYSEAGDHVHLELDDPRKHGDSTYMEITLDSDVEFSFYIGNAPDDTQTTMNCSIDWGDGTVETKTITLSEMEFTGFKLSHNYKAGSYKIELYDVERNYSTVGGYESCGEYTSPISHPSSIKRVVLGSNFIISYMSFGGCTSLASVYIPEGITSIGEGAFHRCDSLTSVYIPESVTSIGPGAFYYCTSIKSIYIPKSVTSIEYGAFSGCSSLTSINIPEGVTSITGFDNCTSLTSVYIPESVTSIEGDAFQGCTSLTSVYIPEGVTSIGRGAFYYCTSLKSINIPKGVTSIGNQVFGKCTSLTSFYIPENITSIEYGVFWYCFGLTSVHISDSVTSIGERAFMECTTLTSVHIPESVTSIGVFAFTSCTSLTSINIPERVTYIGQSTFDSCSNLTSISSLSPTAPSLNYYPFSNMPTNGTLHIKPGATGYDAWLSKLPSGWTIVEDL